MLTPSILRRRRSPSSRVAVESGHSGAGSRRLERSSASNTLTDPLAVAIEREAGSSQSSVQTCKSRGSRR